MQDRLVTIKTFLSPVEANIAKNRLLAEGMKVFLADEEVVSMDWGLGTAVGGIKLQTLAADAERAAGILLAPEETTGEAEDDESLAAEPDAPEPALTDRETTADRAFRGAILGIFFCPLQIWVFCLLLRVLNSDQELRGRYRTRAWIAAWINVLCVLGIALFLKNVIAPPAQVVMIGDD